MTPGISACDTMRDSPMLTMREMNSAERAKLAVMEKIFHQNAERVLGL